MEQFLRTWERSKPVKNEPLSGNSNSRVMWGSPTGLSKTANNQMPNTSRETLDQQTPVKGLQMGGRAPRPVEIPKTFRTFKPAVMPSYYI